MFEKFDLKEAGIIILVVLLLAALIGTPIYRSAEERYAEQIEELEYKIYELEDGWLNPDLMPKCEFCERPMLEETGYYGFDSLMCGSCLADYLKDAGYKLP